MTNHGRKAFHMCVICHALTPADNSGPHYAWHTGQLELIRAMRKEYLERTIETREPQQ